MGALGRVQYFDESPLANPLQASILQLPRGYLHKQRPRLFEIKATKGKAGHGHSLESASFKYWLSLRTVGTPVGS